MSAANNQYEFGVAYRLKNHKFRIPTLFTSTISSVTNTTTIIINNTFKNTDKIVQVGDLLNISNTSNQSENVRIKTILTGGGSLTQFTLKTALVNTYVSTNPVRIFGTRRAGAWDVFGGVKEGTAATEDQKINTIETRLFGKGASDEYGQAFRAGINSKGSAFGLSGLSQDLDVNLQTPFAYHRMGTMFRIDMDVIGLPVSLFMSPHDSVGKLQDYTIIDSSDQFGWTRHALDNGIFFRKNTGSATPKFRITLSTIADPSDAMVFIDDVWLEHAKGTTSTGRIKNASSAGGGIHQITIYETIGTLRGNFNVVSGDIIAIPSATTPLVTPATAPFKPPSCLLTFAIPFVPRMRVNLFAKDVGIYFFFSLAFCIFTTSYLFFSARIV